MNKYKNLLGDRLEEHFSNFLRNSWSFSSVSEFVNNPKAFEMKYIYNIYGQSSAAAVSGNAYHNALELYFDALKDGESLEMVELERIAFDYIENISADRWKIQKTTPTIVDCQTKAFKVGSLLLNNFMKEKSIYEDYIKEVLDVELFFQEWINVNGVDIPLPCKCKIDLVTLTNEDKIRITDHKSKASFTDEKVSQYVIGQQAITYALCYEAKNNVRVDEVCFLENKYSKNKDGSKQLKPIIVSLDDNTRRIYEYFLYEGLRNMIMAIQDPDYIYPINYRDNLNDFNVLFEFAADTLLSEVEPTYVDESKKEMIEKRQKKIKDSSLDNFKIDAIKMVKEHASEFIQYNLSTTDMTNAEKIEHKLRTLGVIAKVDETVSGYSSDTYMISLNVGVKLSTIFKYRLDLAHALGVSGVRILSELFVKDGKSYIAIESSKKRETDLIFDPDDLKGTRLPIGISNFGEVVAWDLDNHSTPHVLICGATGSGKSVSIKSTIEYAKLAGVKNIVVFDPKHEFKSQLNDGSINIHSEIEDIEFEMAVLVEEMNKKVKSGNSDKVLVVFDEFSDAVAQSRKGKELFNYREVVDGTYKDGRPKYKREHYSTDKSLEENLKILLQKGRSSGFRILAATQRASVKVITGDAKVNFPVQICFRVPKEVDSKVVIDESGAETLMGYGDGLIKSPEYNNVIRFQGYFKE
jgi:hypothetical protein